MVKPMIRRNIRGFSLLEMMIVIGIIMILCAISFVSLQPVLRSTRSQTAYNETLNTMRQARALAATQRKTYCLQFTAPRTMQLWRQDPAVAPNPAPPPVLVSTNILPWDMQFYINSPAPATPPDGFSGAQAINFDVSNHVSSDHLYFYPDGSVRNRWTSGQISDGVVYIARPGDTPSFQAISIYGASGILHGWKFLQPTSGGSVWRPQ